MKRQLLLSLAVCICFQFAYAQLKIDLSSSLSVPSSVYSDEIIGIHGGIINVSTNRLDSYYNPLTIFPAFIYTNIGREMQNALRLGRAETHAATKKVVSTKKIETIFSYYTITD